MAFFRPASSTSALARLLAAAALLAALLPVAGRSAAPALAASFVVNSSADPGDGTCDATCTLRDAILGANALAGHDTITFSSTVTTAIVLGAALPTISQDLSIDGSGTAITVDGASLYRPFLATAPLTLTALTIQRGRAPNDGFGGGGAYFGSAGTLWGVTFISNTVPNGITGGGGGARFAASATLSGATFISNTVINGFGGGVQVGGAAVITDTTFLTNSTNYYGGGLYVFGLSTITGSTFISNSANAGGGGAYLFAAALVTGTTFLRNRAAVDFNASGGGVAFLGSAAVFNATFLSNTVNFEGGGAKFAGAAAVRDSVFTGNVAQYGGGAHLAAGSGVTATTFISNTAFSDGGGLYLAAALAGLNGPIGGDIAPITGATFTGNQAQGGSGGGAYLGGPAAVSGSTFSGNTAAVEGGGVAAQASTEVTASEFTSNMATSGGGGRFGIASIFGSLFMANAASGAGGGATFLGPGPGQVSFTTFGGNVAGGNGGGVWTIQYISMTELILYNNRVVGSFTHGGGAYLGGGGMLTGTTVLSNTAHNGHGGGLFGSGISLTNTTVTGNQALCEGKQLQAGPQAVNVDLCGNGGGVHDSNIPPGRLAYWRNAILEDNYADRNGGGLFARGVADNGLTISGIVFEDNTAGERGGAAYLDGSVVHFSQLRLVDNEAGLEAALFIDGSFARIINAEFARNDATAAGAASDVGMSYYNASLEMIHGTFAMSQYDGPAISVGTDLPDEHGQQDTVAHLTNVIFHGYDVGVQGQSPTSTVAISYVLWSAVSTPWQIGIYNLSAQFTGPAAFADEAGGDYHLTAASAAIDKGVPTEVTTDFDGNPRSQGLAPDLGAYEHAALNYAKIYLPSVFKVP